MENKNVIISKDNIVWAIRYIVCITLLYFIYLKFVPFGVYENMALEITKVNYLMFFGWTIIMILLLWMIYIILTEFPLLIFKSIFKKSKMFDGVTSTETKVRFTGKEVEGMVSKFGRKKIKMDNLTRYEEDWEVCQRVVDEAVKEKLKGGKNGTKKRR